MTKPKTQSPSVASIRSILAPLGTADRALHEKAYLKSDLEFLGVKVPEVRKQAKAWLKARPELPKGNLVAFCQRLWESRVHELRSFAIDLSIFEIERLDTEDLVWIERWLRQAGTWAHVDALAIRLVGGMLARYPDVTELLDRWAEDADFWIRRSSMLALLLELRTGEGDWKRFTRYADSMLGEKEFFIRKAIGWILREVSKQRPDRVVRYVKRRAKEMSGLTFREATRRLDPGTQAQLKALRG